jgi:ABC-type amino acid transport system permease subunit
MSFDFAAVINATPYLLQGLVFSIELTLVAMIGGMLLGTFMQSSGTWLCPLRPRPFVHTSP